jgi:hypothetical protein
VLIKTTKKASLKKSFFEVASAKEKLFDESMSFIFSSINFHQQNIIFPPKNQTNKKRLIIQRLPSPSGWMTIAPDLVYFRLQSFSRLQVDLRLRRRPLLRER